MSHKETMHPFEVSPDEFMLAHMSEEELEALIDKTLGVVEQN